MRGRSRIAVCGAVLATVCLQPAWGLTPAEVQVELVASVGRAMG